MRRETERWETGSPYCIGVRAELGSENLCYSLCVFKKSEEGGAMLCEGVMLWLSESNIAAVVADSNEVDSSLSKKSPRRKSH